MHQLMCDEIITPHNLVDNSKLDNYSYVKYYKGISGLIVEMESLCSDQISRKFYYEFNEKDFLQKIIVKTVNNDFIEVLFDRNKEIAKYMKCSKKAKPSNNKFAI